MNVGSYTNPMVTLSNTTICRGETKKGTEKRALSAKNRKCFSRCTSKETTAPLVAVTKQVSNLFAAKQHVNCQQHNSQRVTTTVSTCVTINADNPNH